ncbi:Rv3235 family protein [Cellulomonas sp. PhB143]|uniref:Rv3235 family protein n=1 Tax=Cellulomonas sp. PhB143 TaxID=2485186 RepID=UPI000F9C4315|nr:Rv3235 family protein [Cellulomonas sp. PhB143]ROS78511.1 hypothetical protein EDF32_0408 [Cellulomonas sp. PhB143]
MTVTTEHPRTTPASPAERSLRAFVDPPKDARRAPSPGAAPRDPDVAPTPVPVPVPSSDGAARHLRSAPLGRPPALDATHLRRAPRTAAPGREAGPVRPGSPLTDPTATCCAVARTALEVLRGERPVAQLARWLAPDVHEALARRARLLLAAAVPSAAHDPITVRRARTVRLGPSSAEASVALECGGRVRAVAVRVEDHRGSWRVTALEIG